MKILTFDTENTLERLNKYVDKESSSCWLWLGSVRSSGYGYFRRTENGSVVRKSAHRYFYSEYKGEIPEGLYVLHKEFWLSHAPLHPDELRGRVNIHGHTHYHLIEGGDERYVNVCPEHTYGKPVSIDAVREFVINKTSVRFDYFLGERYGINN